VHKEVPYQVINYLKAQVLHKKKPIQKAIQNTYNYWKAMYDFMKEGLTEEEASRLLRKAVDAIRGN